MLMQSACQLVAAVLAALLHTIEDVCLFVFPPLVTAVAAATSASTAA